MFDVFGWWLVYGSLQIGLELSWFNYSRIIRQAQHKNNERLSFSGLALTKKKSDPPKSVPIETSHVHLQFAESY